MFNHARNPNMNIYYMESNLIFIYALKPIKKGEELFIDYCANIDNQKFRNQILNTYDITEKD